ncbi:MAG: amidohydrolase family protein, partial [Candidatus Heimdallarchaeota archaeon]|nr:amidohydrolase family protein [Candidatus Heimdallarchaeota archaeon]
MAKLVIQNGRMFDSINGRFKHNQTIVCENSLIIWVGDSDSYEPNPEDNTIDATNKTILPGLMDCHVHIELNNDAMRNLEAYQFSTKESYAVLLGLKNAQEYLKYGVTTIRDCAGFIDRGGS